MVPASGGHSDGQILRHQDGYMGGWLHFGRPAQILNTEQGIVIGQLEAKGSFSRIQLPSTFADRGTERREREQRLVDDR